MSSPVVLEFTKGEIMKFFGLLTLFVLSTTACTHHGSKHDKAMHSSGHEAHESHGKSCQCDHNCSKDKCEHKGCSCSQHSDSK